MEVVLSTLKRDQSPSYQELLEEQGLESCSHDNSQKLTSIKVLYKNQDNLNEIPLRDTMKLAMRSCVVGLILFPGVLNLVSIYYLFKALKEDNGLFKSHKYLVSVCGMLNAFSFVYLYCLINNFM